MALGTTANEQYTYDATGNRTTGPQAGTQYTIDLGNQLKASSSASFTYDANGNIITKTEGGTTHTYSYDGENRLIEVKNNGNSIASYKYDPFGRRIEKTVSGVITKYLYDGANILYEYDGADNITARYTHNLGIDDPLGIEKDGKLYTYHKDTLGSIRTITDSAQKTINTYSYDSFGNTNQTGALSQPYGYTGRELDTETGLYYYRARYYDPGVGRFIQKDPIGFRGGINVYNYVGANPLNWVDPRGLDASWPGYEPVPGEPGPPLPEPTLGDWPYRPPVAPPTGGGYCGTYSKAISVCADTASIYSVVATAVSGGISTPVTGTISVVARVVSIANGVVTVSICGASPSTVTTAVGAVAPGWWGAAVSAIDAALTVAGY